MKRAWLGLLAAGTLIVSAGVTAVVVPQGLSASVADTLGHGDPSTNSWSSHCSPTEQAKYDPIMDHGSGYSMHLHDFFGANINVTGETTPADLQSVTVSQPSCNSAYKHVDPPQQDQMCFVHERPPYDEDQPTADGKGEVCDDTAYWTPALLERTDPGGSADQQTPMAPAYVLTYYRNENITDPNTFQEFPLNYAVVAGDQDATESQASNVVAWSCVQAGAPDEAPTTVMPSQCVDQETGHPLFLRMVITFPDCVVYAAQANGMVQPVSDGTPQAEVLYTNDPTNPTQQCPTGNPQWHLVPFIQVGVRWNLNSHQFSDALQGDGVTYDLGDFYLASDFRGGAVVANGVSAHADFMSGWTQQSLNAVLPCLHVGEPPTDLNCGYVVDGGST